MGKLKDIAEKINGLKRGGVYNLETDTEKFIKLTGDAFLQIDEFFKTLGQKSELEDIAEKIKNIRYNADNNTTVSKLRLFFDYAGKAFAQIDKSIDAVQKENAVNKVASNDATQKTIEQVADNQKQR